MSFDERKTFAATKEDLEQNTMDIPVVVDRFLRFRRHRERWMFHCFSTLTRPSRSQLPRHHRKQHVDCSTKYNEIKMDNKLRSARLKTENKKQTVFDSKGPSDLRFGIRYKKGSRVMRCVTLTTPAKTVVRRRSSRDRAVSQSESSNRSSTCLCHCRFRKKSSQ